MRTTMHFVVVLVALLAVGCGRNPAAAGAGSPAKSVEDADGSMLAETQGDDGATDAGGAVDVVDAWEPEDDPTGDGTDVDAGGDVADASADVGIPMVPDITADDGATDGSGVAEIADASPQDTGPADIAPDVDSGATIDIAPGPDAKAGPDAAAMDAVNGDVGDAGSGLPTADPAGPDCKDKRQKGDNKIISDDVWAPPVHYCSSGEGAMQWFGCAPDNSACCLYDIYCTPLGWHECPIYFGKTDPAPAPTEKCPKAYDYDQPPLPKPPAECLPYEPNDTVFCWDNAPEEWKTKKFHMNDEPAP